MIRTVVLAPSFQAVASPAGGGFRLRVDVVGATNVDPEVFLYSLAPPYPGSPAAAAKFEKICSPADAAAYPTLSQVSAAPAIDVPWMRAPYVDLVLATRAEAEEAWSIIQSDVSSLLKAYESQDVLAGLTPVAISAGTP